MGEGRDLFFGDFEVTQADQDIFDYSFSKEDSMDFDKYGKVES